MHPIAKRRQHLKSLNSRLSLAMIAIVIAIGISVLYASQVWMRIYHEELTQKSNASIAMYVVGEHELMHGDAGKPNIETINNLAQQAMIINPMVEVYLLDPAGSILSHAISAEGIKQNRVPVEPIKEFLSGKAEFPLRNTDPRYNDQRQKVFSAAEIRHNNVLQGYLYVVIGGVNYDLIGDDLRSSYSKKMLFFVIGVIVLAALVIGTLVFSLLVRRLSRLSQSMQDFTEVNIAADPDAVLAVDYSDAADEIDVLSETFDVMSAKISWQFDQLREVDQVRRELISNVSHDLRTPLSSIQGYLETLLVKADTLSREERREYLSTALKSSRWLGQLIGDLFELSKLESNSVLPTFESFSLAELIYDIVQEFKLKFEEKNIQVEIVNTQQQAMVHADISLIQRVFENLIRNAITYTPEKGKITFSIDGDESAPHERLKIGIANTGKGIHSEDIPYIFDRFYKNPEHSSEEANSSGLGLAIVKRILELHRSDISVNTEFNEGAMFEFQLANRAA